MSIQRRNTPIFLLVALLMGKISVIAADTGDPWPKSTCKVFEGKGIEGKVFLPAHPAQTRPWLWILPASSPDPVLLASLEQGITLGFFDPGNLYGNEACIAQMDSFYSWVTTELGMSPNPVLMARGPHALAAFRWAARHLDHVAAIFAEDAWLDLRLLSEDTSEEVQRAKAEYTEGTDNNVEGMPLDAAPDFGKVALPVLFFQLNQEKTLATDTQVDLFYQGYRKSGYGPIEIVRSEGSTKEGLDLHKKWFLWRYCGLLASPEPSQPLPAAEEWLVADFSGRAQATVVDGVVIMEKGNDMTGVRWNGSSPNLPYEVTLEAMRLSGGDFFCGLTVPYKDSAFSLIVGGWGGTCVGISSLDFLDAYNNETAQFRTFQDHKWHFIQLRVSEDRIQAWINKEQLVDVSIKDRDVDIRWEMAPIKPLGIATWRTTGAFRNFVIRNL